MSDPRLETVAGAMYEDVFGAMSRKWGSARGYIRQVYLDRALLVLTALDAEDDAAHHHGSPMEGEQ